MNYRDVPYIGIAISIVYLSTFLYCPETPIYLLRQKDEQVSGHFPWVSWNFSSPAVGFFFVFFLICVIL